MSFIEILHSAGIVSLACIVHLLPKLGSVFRSEKCIKIVSELWFTRSQVCITITIIPHVFLYHPWFVVLRDGWWPILPFSPVTFELKILGQIGGLTWGQPRYCVFQFWTYYYVWTNVMDTGYAWCACLPAIWF